MAEGTRKNPLEYQREYNEFMYKLKRFLASKDMPMKKLPQFGGQDIDLYLLYKTVTNFGGWLKVTDDRKWHEVAKNFNLPPSCLNSAFALRQLYVRYLDGYERLYFLGEDNDDTSSSRVSLWNLGGYGQQQMPMMLRNPQRNFERLVLSLQSGLPNEVDFAVNICMLLSNVNNSVFSLTKAPAVIDMVLAHVGVFDEDLCGSSDLYNEWYKNSGKDFLKFWQRVLNCEEIKQLLPKSDNDETREVEEHDIDALFNLDVTVAHKDFELQRVLQVCTILHNFSFDKMDSTVLSSHPVCIRFLMFCLHSNIGSLRKLATDTITNLADKMILEPLESVNSQLVFFMIDRYLHDSDRYNRICAMNVLRKICLQEENQEFVCTALDVQIYEALVAVLVLEDVQLLIPSLETLYQLTGLGQVPCDCLVAVEKSIEILVSILHVCVESFAAQMLAEVKIIDSYHGVAMVPNISGNKQSPTKLMSNSPDARQRSEAESEAIAQHWIRNVYDFDMSSNAILQRDLYADYLTSCGKATRNVLSVPSFYKLLRSVYPDVQIRKLNVANQQLYALVGLRRKLPPGQYFMQAPVHQGSRPPQGGALPQLRQSRTASPPMTMDASHVPRTPTPPIRTEGLVTNVPTLPQSPSLPGQSHDVMFPNARSSQPGNFQLPTRPPASSSPAPPPGVMSASEFLGSLVGTRPPDSTRNSSTPDTPSAPSNLTSSPSQTTASSNVTSKIIGARLPDLVAGSVGPVVTSSPKTDDHPKARMPDVVSGVAGMANGDLSQAKKADQASLIKSSASLNNVGSRELPGAARKFVIVNGTVEEAKVLKSNAVVVNSSQAKLPTVNGTQTNGVLCVGKEERATKMAPTGHEVVISVVENPRKPTTGPSEEINTGNLVIGKKRAQSLLSDITTADKGQSALLVNGPFVASEMLRNVAKRQRRNSEGSSLVNGSSEQKGPMAWDELVRAEAKPPVTSPKLPIAVNGVRLDILPEPAKDSGSKAEPVMNPEKNQLTKSTNPIGNLANTVPGNHGNMSNTSQAKMANAISDANVTSTPLGNHSFMTNNTANDTRPKSPGVPTTNNKTGTLPPATSQVQTTAASTVARSGDTVTVGVTTPKDQTPDNKPRGEQAAGVVLPYRCMWSSCNCSFANSKLLYNHAVSAHAPKEQLFTSCQWEGCTNVRRSRASLLFHLRQRHLTPTKLKDPNLAPKPQKASPPVAPIPPPTAAQPTGTVSHGRAVFSPHPSVNPLLLNLKEQLLQTEQESPLTKSIRLTAGLVLRNIAKYSPSGRRKLKRFESSFTTIMCSKLESNGAVAACLHEMTRPRQENALPKR